MLKIFLESLTFQDDSVLLVSIELFIFNCDSDYCVVLWKYLITQFS